MAKSYTGMDPTYFVGVQSVFTCSPADILEDQTNDYDSKHLQPPNLHSTACTAMFCNAYEQHLPCAITAGSDSAASGSSSNTATQVNSTDQAEDGALNMMAAAVLPLLDRPLPIRKRQRKPNRKAMQAEADSLVINSSNSKRGRKPNAAGRAAVAHLSMVHSAAYALGSPAYVEYQNCKTQSMPLVSSWGPLYLEAACAHCSANSQGAWCCVCVCLLSCSGFYIEKPQRVLLSLVGWLKHVRSSSLPGPLALQHMPSCCCFTAAK